MGCEQRKFDDLWFGVCWTKLSEAFWSWFLFFQVNSEAHVLSCALSPRVESPSHIGHIDRGSCPDIKASFFTMDQKETMDVT